MSDLGLEPVAEPRARKRFRWAPGCIAVLLALFDMLIVRAEARTAARESKSGVAKEPNE